MSWVTVKVPCAPQPLACMRRSGITSRSKCAIFSISQMSCSSAMIRGGFLDPAIRADLIALVRDGKAETRLTRRANALLLLDDGMSCEAIAKVLYLDDDTIRYWYKLYGEKGLNWLADFGYKGRACELTVAQQDALKNWVSQTLPRTTTIVGEWIEKSYGVSYTRSALIKLL